MRRRWLLVSAVCAAIGGAALFAQTPARRPPADLSGEWRSEARVGGRPDVQLVLAVELSVTARMVVRGETKNVTEWMPLTVEHLAWDSRRLTFSTALPHDEGAVYWTFTPTGETTARITGVPDDAEPGDEIPAWNLTKTGD